MKKIITTLLVTAAIVAGCGSSTAAPTLSITKQWARTSPMDATMGAAYFTITSPVDDTLTGVAVDPSVAEMAQMHETVMDNGAMKMQEVASVALKAGAATEFKPGGYHIMLMKLAAPLKVGSTITLSLTLAKAGVLKVSVPVLDQAP